MTNQHYGGDEYDNLTWHPAARDRLGALISATISYRNISMQEYARQCQKAGAKTTFNTIWRLSKSRVMRPSKKALHAIAPHLYRPKSYSSGVVDVDPKAMFGGATGWLELAQWATAAPMGEPDFVGGDSRALADFLIDYCDDNDLTQRNFEALAETKTGLTRDRVRQILGGESDVFESDLYWLSHIIKCEDGTPHSWEFWQDLRRGVRRELNGDEWRRMPRKR